MKQALDDGKVIVCSMGPGDFTTEGHFILIRGYDGNGFYVLKLYMRKKEIERERIIH